MTTAADLLSDLQATIAYLKTLPTITGKIGAIEFCFGGHVAYLAATLPDIAATASFYGAGIATSTPGGGLPTLARTSEIAGTLYAFFGTQDPLIPLEQIDSVEAERRQRRGVMGVEGVLDNRDPLDEVELRVLPRSLWSLSIGHKAVSTPITFPESIPASDS